MSRLPNPKNLIRISRLQDKNLQRRATVLTVLLIATIAVLTLALCTVLLSYLAGTTHGPNNRLLSISAALALTVGLYISLRRGIYLIAAYGVIGIYGALATVAAIHWSINLPSVSLLYCIVIVLAGIALGARYSLYAAGASAVLLLVIQYATIHGNIRPDISWYTAPPHLIDVAVYYLVFAILSVSSWLFNKQTDSALARTLQAETALEHEKKQLELKVKVRTRALEAAQIDKMGQLYRFAQLGQLTTGLLHDLANHMSTLSLDIEGMAEQNRHTQLELRTKQRIKHIDKMVRWAYENINGEVHTRKFSVKREIAEVIKLLRYNARQAHIQLRYTSQPGPALYLRGDPNRFRQLMSNLVTNAIDAYKSMPEGEDQAVDIHLASADDGTVVLSVSDHGVGVPKSLQEKVFQPFYSTKHDGMGIGLFVVKQIAEDYFAGSVALSSRTGETHFTVTLNGSGHVD